MPVIIRGDVHRQDVRYIKTNISNTPQPVGVKPNEHNRCCLKWEVFAQSGGGDALYNDYSAPIKFFSVTETLALELEKQVSGTWTKQADLIDDTYGTFFDLREKDNIKPYGYKIEWYKVLDAFGAGLYRVKFDATTAAFFSDEYCLREYDECLADKTVRFTTVRNSLIGGERQDAQFDFTGLNWYDQIRITSAFFGERKATSEEEFVKLNSGKLKPYKKGFKETFVLRCDRLSPIMMKRLLYDLKQNDLTWVTDYNILNFDRTINELAVEAVGAFEPAYGRLEQSTSLELQFNDAFDNHQKYFS